jgi:hypothetical protein
MTSGRAGGLLGDALKAVIVASFNNDTQVVNNGANGIICSPPPAAAQIVGSPGTVSGNGSDVIACP